MWMFLDMELEFKFCLHKKLIDILTWGYNHETNVIS